MTDLHGHCPSYTPPEGRHTANGSGVTDSDGKHPADLVTGHERDTGAATPRELERFMIRRTLPPVICIGLFASFYLVPLYSLLQYSAPKGSK